MDRPNQLQNRMILSKNKYNRKNITLFKIRINSSNKTDLNKQATIKYRQDKSRINKKRQIIMGLQINKSN